MLVSCVRNESHVIRMPMRLVEGLSEGLRDGRRLKTNVTGPGNKSFKRSSDILHSTHL